MSVIRRALVRATFAAVVAGCLMTALVCFTQPYLIHATAR
ncbi:hypothetical protein GCM10027360_53380 [Amycolatopsis echigonensis]